MERIDLVSLTLQYAAYACFRLRCPDRSGGAKRKNRIDRISRLVLGEFGQTSFPPFRLINLTASVGRNLLSCFFFPFFPRSFYSRFPLDIVLKLILFFLKNKKKGLKKIVKQNSFIMLFLFLYFAY